MCAQVNVFAGKKDDVKSLELSVGFPLFVTISGKICTCENPDKHTELSKFVLKLVRYFENISMIYC